MHTLGDHICTVFVHLDFVFVPFSHLHSMCHGPLSCHCSSSSHPSYHWFPAHRFRLYHHLSYNWCWPSSHFLSSILFLWDKKNRCMASWFVDHLCTHFICLKFPILYGHLLFSPHWHCRLLNNTIYWVNIFCVHERVA